MLRLFCYIANDIGDTQLALQSHVHSITSWLKSDLLTPSVSKTKCMLIGSHIVDDLGLYMNGETMEAILYLGCYWIVAQILMNADIGSPINYKTGTTR